jgi:3-dehydroquinate synthase
MTIKHRLGSYEIAFSDLTTALGQLPPDAWFVTDENVFRLYGANLARDRCIVLPPGEQTKCMRYFEQCLEWLAVAGARRQSTVVALGGGVIGDLAGYVAASYMRGVPFIQIPTTLLAQVDSSVGGKVGIDLKAGKNLAGAFYPPQAVHICLETLSTLDPRQYKSGMAEVLKYGFIQDPSLLKPTTDIEQVVRRCIELKAQVVTEDEFETKGLRAILNFGHTVGHALEQITGYAQYLHGEAISIGMVAEARLGENLGFTEPGTTEVVTETLRQQGLPVELPQSIPVDALVQCMRRDKKSQNTGLAFSFLVSIGQCKLEAGISEADVEKVLGSR